MGSASRVRGRWLHARDLGLVLAVRWRSPVWLALTFVGVVAIPYILWRNRGVPSILGFDAYTTWTIRLDDLYRGLYLDLGTFRYTPAYGQAFAWVAVFPWEVFLGVWLLLIVLILWRWCGRWTLAIIAFPPVALELYHGNIHIFMAAAMVAGFRWPVLWAFPLLSKVTPGVAVLWFLGARQWRNLAIAIGATAAIAAVSLAIAPDLWWEWIAVMKQSLQWRPETPYPVDIDWYIRGPLAAVLAIWGGATGRRWVVPIAACMALPIIWVHGLAMLVAIVPLMRDRLPTPVAAAGHPPSGVPAPVGTFGLGEGLPQD